MELNQSSENANEFLTKHISLNNNWATDDSKSIITPQCDCQNSPSSFERNLEEDLPTTHDSSYIYAVGKIEPRFPSLSLEKEFTQVTGRFDTKGLTDRQVFYKLLSDRSNRYIARQLCWVFTIEGLDTYILQPYDPSDIELLIEAVRPSPSLTDVDVIVGLRGPLAQPNLCNGLMVPIIVLSQIYSFDIESLIKSIPVPEHMDKEKFKPIAEELFMRIMQMADNAGTTDEHRALNYLSVRYPAIYSLTAERFDNNYSLTAVEVRPSRLSGIRKVCDTIFSFTHRQTDVTEKYFCRVDVTEAFPFLVTKLSSFYER